MVVSGVVGLDVAEAMKSESGADEAALIELVESL